VEKKALDTRFSGNRVDLCPVGALTSKVLAFRFRPWERSSVDTVDGLDPARTPIRRNLRGGEVMRVRPTDRGVFISDKSRYARDGLYKNRRAEVYRYGEVVSVEKGLETLAERRGPTTKVVRGTSVDRNRVGKRVERSRKGVRQVETRGSTFPDKRKERRFHQEDRGIHGEKRTEVLSKAEAFLRRGREVEKERPMRQRWRRSVRVTGAAGGDSTTGEGRTHFVQRGPGGYGRTTGPAHLDLGQTPEARVERREGRHRRSQVRTESSVRRRSETRRTRRNPRRLEGFKGRDRVNGRRRVNLLNLQQNTSGRRALDRQNRSEASIGEGKAKRVRVGIDEGERREHGRLSLEERTKKLSGDLACILHSHAPVVETPTYRGERRLPRKTWVESDQRRTNREGKAVWTTGVGVSPSRETRTGDERTTGVHDRRWSQEERSDPIRRQSPEDEARTARRATRGVKGRDSTWNDRRRPDRYDGFREGHALARVSTVMAKTSKSRAHRA